MNIFSIERVHWPLFHNMYTSVLNKFWQENISKVGGVFIFCHIVLTVMLNWKISIWRLIHIKLYDMSTVDLTANIRQWKNVQYNNWIRIDNWHSAFTSL